MRTKRHYNIPVFLPHAACPFRCIFCDQYLITSQIRIPEPNQVKCIVEETLSTISDGEDVEIAFFGGNFTALPIDQQKLYLEAVQPWIQSGKIQNIRISTRPDCIDLQCLQWLKDYGVRVVELGIQSFQEDVLYMAGRGYTSKQACKACQDIKEAGLQLGVQLMPGLPYDTMEKSIESAQTAIKLGADMARIYPTVVLKGTALATMMRRGIYQPMTVKQAIEVTKEMFLKFEAAQIPVIRIGLYGGEDLQNDENVEGGAFHPALGELVEQQIFLEQTRMLLQKMQMFSKEFFFYVNQRDLSKFMGWKRKNWLELKKDYPLSQVKGISLYGRNWIGIGEKGTEIPKYILTRKEYLDCRIT